MATSDAITPLARALTASVDGRCWPNHKHLHRKHSKFCGTITAEHESLKSPVLSIRRWAYVDDSGFLCQLNHLGTFGLRRSCFIFKYAEDRIARVALVFSCFHPRTMSLKKENEKMKKQTGKVQRSLDSFLFKGPPKPAASVLTPHNTAAIAPQHTPVELPRKKPRLEEPPRAPSQPASDHTVSRHFPSTSASALASNNHSRDATHDASEDALRPESDVDDEPVFLRSSNGAGGLEDRPDNHKGGNEGRSEHGSAPLPKVPARKVVRHQKFQNKLVEDPAFEGRRRSGVQEDIVPQKHTPLELQVVELKKKYPDCILIIEVRFPCIALWLSHQSMLVMDMGNLTRPASGGRWCLCHTSDRAHFWTQGWIVLKLA